MFCIWLDRATEDEGFDGVAALDRDLGAEPGKGLSNGCADCESKPSSREGSSTQSDGERLADPKKVRFQAPKVVTLT